MRLGAVADDFTGATDLANNLVRNGMRSVQMIGLPDGAPPLDAESVVVALKSRTAPVGEAIGEALEALKWLRRHGAGQIYFKYCSTFDSTPVGNIGPVTEALMDALDCDFTIATPAFPDNGRTVFKGHLFVGDALLHESGMQNHPLTPMRDANLVRVLQAQCRRKVGLIDYRCVAQGEGAIRARISALRAERVAIAVVDAISNDDLVRLGAALRGMPLVTAGSGVAIGLPANWGLAPDDRAARLPAPRGLKAAVSGSCSLATNRQVVHFIQTGRPAFAIDPLRLAATGTGSDLAEEALAWAEMHLEDGPVLIYSTVDAATVTAVQEKLGAEQAGALVEQTIASIACGLVRLGVRQLIVAGGETAGACVRALGIRQLQIGAQIDPGVPWCYATIALARDSALHIALKSGNFGGDDFFIRSFRVLA